MKTTAWLATLASAAPALAMPGPSGFAGTKRGSWKNTSPAQYYDTPQADDAQSSGPMSSSSLSEPASNPPKTESIWGSRFLAALFEVAHHTGRFSYEPISAATTSDPLPEVAPTTVVSMITEYASETPTAVPYLDEKTVTVYETIYESVCSKSSPVDFYNPNSPPAAPETNPSSHSVLTPAHPYGPIHASGDSIVTSTFTSHFETTATETDFHTVPFSAGSENPSAPVGQAGGDPSPAPTTSLRANPSNYGNIPLTHSTKVKPEASAPPSMPSASSQHESMPKAGPASSMSSHDSDKPKPQPAPPSESPSHGHNGKPSEPKSSEGVEHAGPAAPSNPVASSPDAGHTTSVGGPSQPIPIPDGEDNKPDSTPVASIPVPTTWVNESISKFTSVYATAVPTTSIWTLKNSNVTRSSTFLVNTTMTSVWTSSVSQTHTSELVPGDHSTVTRRPGPLGGNSTATKAVGNFTPPSSCTAKPVQTDFCIPCDGQPGDDPDSFCGYTVHDDNYKVTPKTCRTREYFLEISNTTIAPDGVERVGLLINGQMPGPLIEASWGDTVIVHLENKLQNNGTSIHFHGLRQYETNEMDGVPSITQCALAPGEKMTYTFVATNYGSTWYHSHFALQTYDGVFGPMIIHGPSSAEYDIDSGFAVLQDWSHETVEAKYHFAETIGEAPHFGPQTLDTGLINGMNVWSPDNGTTEMGSRFEMTFQPGKTHLIRVVNTAIQSTFKFHIDGHKFTVISADFVPIEPYETDILNINIGQRYNILVTADQEPGDYWMRSDNQQACAELYNSRDIKGIVHYEGFTGTPNTISREYKDECIDEPYEKLVPVAPLSAGPQTSEIHKNILVGEGPQTPNLFKWTLDGNTFQSQWGDPTLGGIYWNDTIPSYSGNLAIEIPKLKEWVYIIVESPVPLPHPIHLHGHDSLILAQGTGPYSDDVALKLDNPPRRDTAIMPFDPETGEGGYLVIGFETDNPGAWLMHCHIGWHVSMGFALQIIEAKDQIRETVTDSCQLEGTCKTWNQYAALNHVVPHDSGV
ncbi:hypothetical protein Q7P37_001008 [Cladosporium fusiforme]